MTKTVLLTLGRLPKALELARCLDAAGCRVIVAEPFGLHLCRGSRAVAKTYKVVSPNVDATAYRREMLRVIEAEGVDIVVPVSEEVMHVAQVARGYDGPARFVGASFEVLDRLHNKLAFAAWARELGLPSPDTALASSVDADAIIASGDYVLKPALGCAGSGLRFGEKGEGLPALDHPDGMIVQRRIRGRERSTLSFVRDGVVLGTVVYQGLVLSGTVAVAFERCDDEPEIVQWVETFAAKTGYTGFIAFDFIVDDAGCPWPLECNPRLTSGLHFFDHPSLAEAVLEPGTTIRIGAKPRHRLQEGHTALALAYGNALRPREFARRLRGVFGTADVKWSWRDPVPFMFFSTLSWPILQRTLFGGMTLTEASTRDIEWLGDSLIK